MTVTIADGSCVADNPQTLKAGEVMVTLDVVDKDKDLYALILFHLDEGKDLPDLVASTVGCGAIRSRRVNFDCTSYYPILLR
jgi:hypothetical protein